MRLDKDRSDLNKAFREMKRGDVVNLDGVQSKGAKITGGERLQSKISSKKTYTATNNSMAS